MTGRMRRSNTIGTLGDDFDYEEAAQSKHNRQVDISVIKLILLWRLCRAPLIEAFKKQRVEKSRSVPSQVFKVSGLIGNIALTLIY